MRILYLPLKKEWYEMIESGVKTEEYREIKPYWTKRLVGHNFTHVQFSYGYTKRTMTYKLERITFGKGNPEWGAPTEEVFKIKLGKRVWQQTESKRKRKST